MNKYITIYCLALLLLTSCGGMNDNIDEYLNRGEVNYIGKVDSVQSRAGNKRIQLNWLVNTDPRIEGCKIYWNDRLDSLYFPINRNQIVNGRISTVFEIKEGRYIFDMHHVGEQGYQSIKEEVIANVYGENYESTLTPRRIIDVVPTKGQVAINWRSADQLSFVNFVYKNNKSQNIIRLIPASEMRTVITDYLPGSEFSYETCYLPEINALDTFKVQAVILTFPEYYKFNKQDWMVIDFSDEQYGSAKIIDNDPKTFWHSKWEPDAPLPHHLTVDMQEEKSLNKVSITRCLDNNDLKKTRIDVSLDNVHWTEIGELEFSKTISSSSVDLILKASVKARYIKIVVTESNRPPYASIAEINAEGTE